MSEHTETETRAEVSKSAVEPVVSQPAPPVCHMTPMRYEWADDGRQQVEFWDCVHCGHTKEFNRVLAG